MADICKVIGSTRKTRNILQNAPYNVIGANLYNFYANIGKHNFVSVVLVLMISSFLLSLSVVG